MCFWKFWKFCKDGVEVIIFQFVIIINVLIIVQWVKYKISI